MKRRTDTEDSRRFWEGVDEIARRVRAWPEWKLRGFVGGERIFLERRDTPDGGRRK